MLITLTKYSYQYLLKPILFQFDPEGVHVAMTSFGEQLGKQKWARGLLANQLVKNYPSLSQNLAGIKFNSPIGLSAGFDYDAKLTQISGSLGFGFQTVGTITNNSYEGNPKPRLGRLPKSKSLMVNKGFKNLGAAAIAAKLAGKTFDIPIGISIGRTNSEALNQKESVDDIIQAFKAFENAQVKNSYYELNISCPNLKGTVTFYTPAKLDQLLKEIDKLKLKKPLFVKMPISSTDKEILAMLKVIAKHSPAGVIFGNLQKDKSTLNPIETKKFSVGNFSGKPTFDRSNHLIFLAFKNFKKRFVIIGSGGVFNSDDAYTKIKAGASLVQLITGMVYQGPQLIAEINQDLAKRLKQDNYSNISQAVGTKLVSY